MKVPFDAIQAEVLAAHNALIFSSECGFLDAALEEDNTGI